MQWIGLPERILPGPERGRVVASAHPPAIPRRALRPDHEALRTGSARGRQHGIPWISSRRATGRTTWSRVWDRSEARGIVCVGVARRRKPGRPEQVRAHVHFATVDTVCVNTNLTSSTGWVPGFSRSWYAPVHDETLLERHEGQAQLTHRRVRLPPGQRLPGVCRPAVLQGSAKPDRAGLEAFLAR